MTLYVVEGPRRRGIGGAARATQLSSDPKR